MGRALESDPTREGAVLGLVASTQPTFLGVSRHYSLLITHYSLLITLYSTLVDKISVVIS
ncbi:MAG: hypothetical protein F6K47_17070 [Symploca sp. SIO2E6]|nr:hypothetical protein [Symploca sp. SIO2E6]